MFLLLFIMSVRGLPLMISEDDFTLFLYQLNGNYTIVTNQGNSSITYTYPIESEVQLGYDGNFTINHKVNIVQQNGTITPPEMIQNILGQRINRVEPAQVCYDFTTERIGLKVVLAVIALLFIASHGPKGWLIVQTVISYLHRPTITRRFSRTASSMGGSKNSYTTLKKETGV